MGKTSTPVNTIKAIKNLRTKGYTIPEISSVLKISKTTVFRYASMVKISPKYIAEWKVKRGGSRKKMLEAQQKAYLDGKNLIGTLTYKEKILLLSALYWGEGSKGDLGLSNTNPDLIKVFVSTLKECFNVQDDELRISIRIYEDLDKDECLNFWSKVVNIPKENIVSVNILPGKKSGKLKYGMCRIRVLKGGIILKQLKGIIQAVSEEF